MNYIKNFFMICLLISPYFGWLYFTIKKWTKTSIVLGLVCMALPIVVIVFANSITSSYQYKYYINSLAEVRKQLKAGHSQKVIKTIDNVVKEISLGRKINPQEVTQKLRKKD